MDHHATLVRSAEPLEYSASDAIQNPVYHTFERLGVDEVRTITLASMLRPVNGAEQVFVLRTLFVTHEAQNALLKLLEEPPAGLSFVVVVPQAVSLLPTLMSRFGIEQVDDAEIDTTAWDLFVSATAADRLKQIDAWQKTKDPQWLQAIVRGVQSLKSTEVPVAALPAVQIVSERLATRGASNKMLLEHLALALPLRK